MNVVFFIRDITDCGGIQQTTCNLINTILKTRSDYHISVISIYNKNSYCFFNLSDTVNTLALFTEPINIYHCTRIIGDKLESVLHELPCDVLIIQGTEYANYLRKKTWEQKVIICEHGYFGFGHTFGFHWRGVRISLKKGNSIITLTNADASEYKKRAKRNVLIKAIYNSFSPVQDESLIQYDTNSRTIVSCGSLIPLKRFDIVINAAAEVLPDYPEWKWEIYGDGVLREQLQSQINEKNLSEQILLKGYESNKATIYSGKSFLVMSSMFEGFGMVLIEAMQYKLPLIAFDVKYGPKEIIQDGINGYLVPDCNMREFVNRLKELINSFELRKEFSINTAEALTRFDPDTIASQWIDVIEKVNNQRGKK